MTKLQIKLIELELWLEANFDDVLTVVLFSTAGAVVGYSMLEIFG